MKVNELRSKRVVTGTLADGTRHYHLDSPTPVKDYAKIFSLIYQDIGWNLTSLKPEKMVVPVILSEKKDGEIEEAYLYTLNAIEPSKSSLKLIEEKLRMALLDYYNCEDEENDRRRNACKTLRLYDARKLTCFAELKFGRSDWKLSRLHANANEMAGAQEFIKELVLITHDNYLF